MRFSFSSRVAIFKRSCVFYSRKMRVMSSLAPTIVTLVASISKMTQYVVWVKRSLGWSFTRWLISFQLFAFSSQNPNLPRCLISFKYTLRTVSLFFLVLRVKRARHEMTTRMTGEALFSSWAAALIWRVSSLRRSRVRALPSLIRRKRETGFSIDF